jgi:hypothetical protein
VDIVAIIARLASSHIVWHDLSSLSLLSKFVHEVKRLKLSAEVPYSLFYFLRRFRRDQSTEYDDGASANHLV